MIYNYEELSEQFDKFWQAVKECRIGAISLVEDNEGVAFLTNEREVGQPLYDDQTTSMEEFEPDGCDIKNSMFDWLAENADEVED